MRSKHERTLFEGQLAVRARAAGDANLMSRSVVPTSLPGLFLSRYFTKARDCRDDFSSADTNAYPELASLSLFVRDIVLVGMMQLTQLRLREEEEEEKWEQFHEIR